ncbi:MAG TPA: sortase, partial [Anaerolineales bacterium]|nr:sortase [Anaerolineales bacterium]
GITDTNSANNSASDTDTQNSQTDLGITKTDNRIYYLAGDTLNYVVVVTNHGPADVTGAVVSDAMPAQIIAWTWSCAPATPAAYGCDGGTSAPFSDTIDLPAGASITYNVSAGVTATPSGDLVNTATVTSPVTDTNPANNTASDTDGLAALTVTKDDGISAVSPGTAITYTVTVTNAGTASLPTILLTDTLPAEVTFASADGSPTQAGNVLTWPLFSLAPLASTSFDVTVNVNSDAVGPTIVNQVTARDTTSGTEASGSDTDYIVTLPNSDLTKILVPNGDSLAATTNPDVAIGEILTYQVTFNVPPGQMTNLTLTDTLDPGLAFVNCQSITPSTLSVVWQDPATPAVPASNDFSSICSAPQVNAVGDPASASSAGRQVVFDFHDINNPSNATASITLLYRVVVLDVVENHAGSSDLNNGVVLAWDGGPLQTTSPTPLHILEPKLTLQKTADITAGMPGTVITFTLQVAYDPSSTADAYDVLLTDVLPQGLTYVPGSLTYISGNPPNSAIPPTPAPALDDTAAPTLRVHWDLFPSTAPGNAVIQFQAVLGDIGRGSIVTNTANVEWTSLPGIPPSPAATPALPAGQESIYNPAAHERRYDPVHPADIYGASSSATIGIPRLPATGFAPGQTTFLPDQPVESQYADLGDLWLEIPALGVKASIVGVPANSSGWDLTWLGDQIGYLYGTAYPTWTGNTGLTGHVYTADGKPGPFVNISKLVWGQEVIVHMGGQKYIYQVQDVRRVWPEDLSVLKHATVPTLTLITCQGYNQADNDYRYRIAVRAILVSIEPEIPFELRNK